MTEIYISLNQHCTVATKEIPAPSQSWRGCNHPTSNWPYQGHQVPSLAPRTAKCLSSMWSNTDHLPYALVVCSVTWMSWRILHSWLIIYSLQDGSRDLHSGIPTISGIFLSDVNGQTLYGQTCVVVKQIQPSLMHYSFDMRWLSWICDPTATCPL